MNYARLAKQLAAEGKNEKAKEALDFCMNSLPLDRVGYDPYTSDVIDAYFTAGDTAKAADMSKALADHYFEELEYYLKQDSYIVNSAEYEIRTSLNYLSMVATSCINHGKKELGDEINTKMNTFVTEYLGIVQPEGKLK
jgi:hypothetical protein